MSNEKFNCKLCNKKYKSYVGLWKHQKKHKIEPSTKDDNKIEPSAKNDNEIKPSAKNDNEIEPSAKNDNKIDQSDKYNCINCNKNFKYRQNRYKHQLSCCEKNKIIDIENKLEIIENKLADCIQPINNIVNNYTYSNTINNTANFTSNININKIGSENINELTYEEVKTIFRTHTNCLITLINTLNFNERLPQNHSFCVTSLDGKYVSVYNTDKNLIEKRTKKNFYDEIFNSSISTMYKLFNDIKNKVSIKKAKNLELMIQNVKSLVIENSKIKNTYNNELNLLSYNNRDIVLNSWEKILPSNLLEDDNNSESDSSKDSFYYLTDSD